MHPAPHVLLTPGVQYFTPGSLTKPTTAVVYSLRQQLSGGMHPAPHGLLIPGVHAGVRVRAIFLGILVFMALFFLTSFSLCLDVILSSFKN